MVWWVGGWFGWVDGWDQVKTLKILKMLTESRLFKCVLRFMICRDTPTHGWVCGLVCGWVGQWVWSGQMTKILISFDLIEIIQFSLKIYDL